MAKICLIIVDGFGIAEKKGEGDATAHAKHIETLKSTYSFTELFAHGKYVGLPDGIAGNSEVGHMTIGAGRIVSQSLLRISHAYKTGELKEKIDDLKKDFTGRIHLIGLLSDGAVHSHIDHVEYLREMLPEESKVFVHAIADGRDTAPKGFGRFFSSTANIVSVAGRYYTMDRDRNDERVEKAFQMMTNGIESEFSIDSIYGKNLSDEFIPPTLINADGKIKKDDTLIFFNFRVDRMRQIGTRFKDYKNVYTMVDYGIGIGKPIFECVSVANTLPEWLSKNRVEQAHIAETEKYAHVTYFLNGGNEAEHELETRVMVPSPKVGSFEECPETGMRLVTGKCVEAIERSVAFIVANMAGPDLLGHTGNYEKTVEAVQQMDTCILKIYRECLRNGYTLVITADHGNAERMLDDKGMACKKHTTNKVPLIISRANLFTEKTRDASLADVAPTVCALLGIPIPPEMTGASLIELSSVDSQEEESGLYKQSCSGLS